MSRAFASYMLSHGDYDMWHLPSGRPDFKELHKQYNIELSKEHSPVLEAIRLRDGASTPTAAYREQFELVGRKRGPLSSFGKTSNRDTQKKQRGRQYHQLADELMQSHGESFGHDHSAMVLAVAHSSSFSEANGRLSEARTFGVTVNLGTVKATRKEVFQNGPGAAPAA